MAIHREAQGFRGSSSLLARRSQVETRWDSTIWSSRHQTGVLQKNLREGLTADIQRSVQVKTANQPQRHSTDEVPKLWRDAEFAKIRATLVEPPGQEISFLKAILPQRMKYFGRGFVAES